MEVKVMYQGHSSAIEVDNIDRPANDAQARSILGEWWAEQVNLPIDLKEWNLMKLTTSPKHPGRVWVTFEAKGADLVPTVQVDFRWDTPQPSDRDGVEDEGDDDKVDLDTPPDPGPAPAPAPAAAAVSKTPPPASSRERGGKRRS